MVQPSPVEQSIGLTTFYTSEPGVGGILRYRPEDFIVEEQTQSFPEDSTGRFLLVYVTAKNWETNDLIHKFAKALHISKKRISFAGTKDKRAVSSQLFCFYRVSEEQMSAVSIPDVSFRVLHKSSKRVNIGDLKGNTFSIVIRKIPSSVDTESVNRILTQLQSIQGFANFFGVQRFGGIRPITHLVGREMVNADFRKAVMIYLTETSPYENHDATLVRENLAETNDFKTGFHEFPNRLRFEKILMQHLIKNPDDYAGALQKLPDNLLTMFVYAFQSYLFNRMLSHRIKQNIPIEKAILGDIILPVTRKGIEHNPIRVSAQNNAKVNEQIKKGKAVVSCVLPGSETTFADGEMGKIQHQIIKEEQVDIRDFIIPEIPTASSYGTNRAMLSPIQNLSWKLQQDEYHTLMKKLHVTFFLPKGSYATSFLREIMKLEDITKY